MLTYGRTAYTFTWKNGRQLATATANGKTLSFTYNDQGMRLTKTVDGVTHTYSLDGDRIVAEEWGNQLLVYFYDDDGLPMGMMYRNSSYADKQFDYYLYEKDVFGNIIAIYNASGTKVASYCYDAWGNCTVLTNVNGIGTLNPFRYRGYYLDTETNLYYLQSRYYDAYTGRFINADGQLNGGLLGYNLFAYCENNPVMYVDPTGESVLIALLIGAAIGAVSLFAITMCVDYMDDGEIFNGSVSAVDYVCNTAAGALLGVAAGLFLPEIGALLAGGTGAASFLVGGEVAVVVAAETISVGSIVLVAGLMFAKQAKRSGKENASNKPSWVNNDMVDLEKSANQNATDIMNNKYGRGNWKPDTNTEFSRIKKWITRKIFFYKK